MVVRLTMLGMFMIGFAACSNGKTAESGECCEACGVESTEGGWTPLFDGKTTDGWRNWKSQSINPGWQVQDGALARVSEGAGNIITEKQFSNFDLRFDWKVGPKGNSGVFYHVSQADDMGLITSPEYQVLDNKDAPDGKNPKTSAASNYALYAPTKDVTKPLGEWNEGRIVVKGNHVEHWLNGEKVVEYELGSADWKERVAASKFTKWPAYGTRRAGHIAIQDHGDPVAYRNIKIKELPAP